MTKEITKAFILQQIQDKFKLRELEPEVFAFSELVVPVYNIEQHLAQWNVMKKVVNITGSSYFDFFIVPENERWTVRSYMLVFGMTGAHKASGLLVYYRPTVTDMIYLDLKEGQEISYLVNLPAPVVLHPGNRIAVMIDTYTSPQNLTVYVDVMKEEIR